MCPMSHSRKKTEKRFTGTAYFQQSLLMHHPLAASLVHEPVFLLCPWRNTVD